MSEENNLLKAAIDTNIVISGMISPNSIPCQLLELWSKGIFEWVLTEDIFEEINQVLRRDKLVAKYQIENTDAENLLENLIVGAEFVTPLPHEQLPIHSRDEKDDKFLACAFGGECDYLISGDDDLLILNGKKELGKLRIIKPAEFLQTIDYQITS